METMTGPNQNENLHRTILRARLPLYINAPIEDQPRILDLLGSWMPILENSNTVNSAGFVFFEEQGPPSINNTHPPHQNQNTSHSRRQQTQRVISSHSSENERVASGASITNRRRYFQLTRLASRDLSPAPVHPHFQRKQVYELFCKHCSTLLCWRGMKANLLGDTKVELYSTDVPSKNVQPVYQAYVAKSCSCKICDAACLSCGNIVGYNVTHPCDICLASCNNGHFWMFKDHDIYVHPRKVGAEQDYIYWSSLPVAEKDLIDPLPPIFQKMTIPR